MGSRLRSCCALAAAVLAVAAPGAGALGLSPARDLGLGASQIYPPAVTGAADGGVLVLRGGWSGGPPVLAERRPDGTWLDPVELPGAADRGLEHDAALGRRGAAAIVWRANRPRRYARIRVAVRAPGAAGFGTPVTLANLASGGVRRPAVAVDDRGGVLVAWLAKAGLPPRARDAGQVTVAYRPPGGPWQRPRRLTRRLSRAARVALSPDGHGLVTWRRGTVAEAVALTPAGRPGAVRRLGRAGGPYRPVAAMARGGRAAIAWATRDAVWVAGRATASRPFATRRAGPVRGGFLDFDGPLAVAAADGALAVAWRTILQRGSVTRVAAVRRDGGVGPAHTVTGPSGARAAIRWLALGTGGRLVGTWQFRRPSGEGLELVAGRPPARVATSALTGPPLSDGEAWRMGPGIPVAHAGGRFTVVAVAQPGFARPATLLVYDGRL